MSFVNINGKDFYYDKKFLHELCHMNCCHFDKHAGHDHHCEDNHKCFCWIDKPDNYCAMSINLLNKYLKPEHRVLELDGNLGVTSCHINSILSNPESHVVTESSPTYQRILEKNKDIHGSKFKILKKEIEDINPEKDIDLDFNFIFSDSDGPELSFFDKNIKYLSENVDCIILNYYHISHSRGSQGNDTVYASKVFLKLGLYFSPQINPESVSNIPIQVFINKNSTPKPVHYLEQK